MIHLSHLLLSFSTTKTTTTTSTDTIMTSSTTTNNSIMKICVLQSANEACEYEGDDPPANVLQHLLRGGYTNIQVDMVQLRPIDYSQQLVQIAQQFKNHEYTCVINLCDGAWDEPSVGIDVVALLEQKLNVPFTGADTAFYEPTRLQMKKVALACGIAVPAWRFVYTVDELHTLIQDFRHYDIDAETMIMKKENKQIVHGDTSTDSIVDIKPSRDDETDTSPSSPPLRFPLLVKHFSSYSSIGLTKDSKVWNVDDLEKQCLIMMETFGGCLVEEFIEGREFTVLASDVAPSDEGIEETEMQYHPVKQVDSLSLTKPMNVMAYDPVECIFGKGEDFKHYNLKWVDYDKMAWRPVQDKVLSQRLKDMAKDIFRGMQGRGYGRIDVRSDPTGKDLYLLEINPNCGIFYPEGFYGSADFILDMTDPMQGHADFILNQVKVALHLWKKKNTLNSLFESRYDARKDSWGLFALRDYQPGDIVQYNEETPFHLVSKSHVLKTWEGSPTGENAASDEKMRTWENFAAYCWPLNDNLFAMWQPNPDDWKPINHSCDPNVWNEFENGLNLVARYPIKAGDEIRMDYASFVGYFPEMKSFNCDCGTATCRGVISGMDIIRHPELAVRYRGHMSSYIASKARDIERYPPFVAKVIDEKKDDVTIKS